MKEIEFLLLKKKKKLPLILQSEMAECGHACVAMISNYWGHDLDIIGLRKIQPPSSRGINLLHLKMLFENLGFQTRALRIELDELRLIKTPVVLHWNLNHFVVLKEVKKNGMIIHDPALGVCNYTMEEASRSFTGIVLEIEKLESFKPIHGTNKLRITTLLNATQGLNYYLMFLIAISFFIEILTLFNPLLMQYVTDTVISSHEMTNLYIIALGFLFLILIQIIAEYFRGNMVIYLTNHLTLQFSQNIIRHLLKLPLDFFEKRKKGDIQSKFQSVDQIQKKISTDLVNAVLDGFMILMNLLVMLVYSVTLTIIVFFSLMFYFGIRYFSFRILKKYTAFSIGEHAKSATIFLETLQAIMPIKSFQKEEQRFNTWKNTYISALNADIKVARLNVIYHAANQFLFNIEPILIICIGASFVLQNRFSLGMLFAFLSFRLLLVNKTSSLIQNLVEFKLISIQLTRLSDILFQNVEPISVGLKNNEAIKGNLTLANISYQYDANQQPIFKNINLKIDAGEKIAITGSSGSGKSTLLKVMMGLFNPTSGEVLIDNKSIEELGLKNYRYLIASVMQDDTLLAGSILENIVFFDEEIDYDRVQICSSIASIHETICQFPMGYETLVGEMGSTLSGGQKQRILLARALYKQPKILFLDEATSHLDHHNEKTINEALSKLNITQIIIAHRMETIKMADRIINMEELKASSP